MKGKNRAAIITSSGLGDGLIMLIIAKSLKSLGYSVFIFNDLLTSLQPLFNFLTFKKNRNFNLSFLKNFDLIILQNDNSEKSKKIISFRNFLKKLKVLYPSYNKNKHFPLEKEDFVCNYPLPLADNVSIFCKDHLSSSNSKDIGISLPKNLIHKKHKKRIIIHPTSSDVFRNWSQKKFINLAKKLAKQGFEPFFIMTEEEKKSFKKSKIPIFSKKSLTPLVSFIYESSYFIGNDSGPGHMASFLNLPSIIITNDEKRLFLWQPGWRKATILFPSFLMPNIKWLRLKEKYWQPFISVSRVLKTFKKLSKKI
jgi:hypothetical protein